MIKCVALWEMRYWAASMASITAKTLFCREEMRDFDQPKLKSKPKFRIQTEGLVYLLAGPRPFSPGTSYSDSMHSLKGNQGHKRQQ